MCVFVYYTVWCETLTIENLTKNGQMKQVAKTDKLTAENPLRGKFGA